MSAVLAEAESSSSTDKVLLQGQLQQREHHTDAHNDNNNNINDNSNFEVIIPKFSASNDSDKNDSKESKSNAALSYIKPFNLDSKLLQTFTKSSMFGSLNINPS
jgi:hypothetical protein